MSQLNAICSLLLVFMLCGCATLPNSSDAPTVKIVGFEPLPSEALEARFSLKLRVQNHRESALAYNGLSVKLKLDGKGLASGVSNTAGEIARFSEEVLDVPVSISAVGVLRQVIALAKTNPGNNDSKQDTISYSLTGKLGAAEGSFGAVRFNDVGEINLFPNNELRN